MEETMNSSETDQAVTKKEKEPSLEISLQAVPSNLNVSGNRVIPFTRAILAMRNIDPTAVTGIKMHATLSQEGGIVYDVTDAIYRSNPVESIPPGETVAWDVYDLILTEHAGVASKVHLWGYKAVLNWWFELTAWAECRSLGIVTPLKTPTSRWKLRWNPAVPPADEINLSTEVVKD
jgi:hypothetical protein